MLGSRMIYCHLSLVLATSSIYCIVSGLIIMSIPNEKCKHGLTGSRDPIVIRPVVASPELLYRIFVIMEALTHDILDPMELSTFTTPVRKHT